LGKWGGEGAMFTSNFSFNLRYDKNFVVPLLILESDQFVDFEINGTRDLHIKGILEKGREKQRNEKKEGGPAA
jgi:hypothetical protein